jgi:hypothetical protein
MPNDTTIYGSFLPTTGVWDNSQQSMVAVRQNINSIIIALNAKDAGYHVLTEFVDGALWYTDPLLSSTTAQSPELRQEFRKVVIIGALPNSATIHIAHGLAFVAGSTWMFTKIEGIATKPGNAVGPVQPAALQFPCSTITLDIDQTNINITTTADYSLYTKCVVILEFLKN